MFYWIDTTADVAYVAVRGALPHFPTLLALFDRVFADPQWRPDVPIVEDVRELTIRPPATCLSEWRDYVRERRPIVGGCRWAIIAPDTDARLRAILRAAARDAAANGVTMEVFGNMIDAHVWLARRGFACHA